jgi:argininosuccinate lyase
MIRKGRFSEVAAEIALRYGESVSFDWWLYRYDIARSIAPAPGNIVVQIARWRKLLHDR